MQCLSQTHPLTQLIDIQSSKGANFSVKVSRIFIFTWSYMYEYAITYLYMGVFKNHVR